MLKEDVLFPLRAESGLQPLHIVECLDLHHPVIDPLQTTPSATPLWPSRTISRNVPLSFHMGSQKIELSLKRFPNVNS
jgi:hypothetical protein